MSISQVISFRTYELHWCILTNIPDPSLFHTWSANNDATPQDDVSFLGDGTSTVDDGLVALGPKPHSGLSHFKDAAGETKSENFPPQARVSNGEPRSKRCVQFFFRRTLITNPKK
jgi:hypothetical protein